MLPFYGRFDHFQVAVESVLAQTDGDWRLTVVDDVYPDLAPGEWLVGLGDRRIEYLRNKKNLGVSKNYLQCVGLMQGEFSVMFGCDDVMLSSYVARAKQLIAEFPHAGVIQPGAEVIDEDGTVYKPLVDRVKGLYRPQVSGPRALGGEGLATSLLRGNWTYFPSLLWRVDLLKRYGFDPDLDVVQDIIMLLDIISEGGSLVLDNQVVFQYRRHQSSVSSATAVSGARFQQERELFDRESKRFSALGWNRAARAARRRFSSRMNALTRVPQALRQRNLAGVRVLLRHLTGS